MIVSRWPRVVAIDSADAARTLWRELAAQPGLRVTTFDCREATREALREARPDVVVLDWSIGSDPWGWPLLHALSIDACLQEVPVVICADSAIGGPELPATDESVHILPKPFGLDELVAVISTVLGDARSVPPACPGPD